MNGAFAARATLADNTTMAKVALNEWLSLGIESIAGWHYILTLFLGLVVYDQCKYQRSVSRHLLCRGRHS